VFTEKDLEDHRIIASGMDWDDLADMVITLELERHEMIEILSKHKIKLYDKIIDIYEVEKISIMSRYERIYNNIVHSSNKNEDDELNNEEM
jgi:hypothetical protein